MLHPHTALKWIGKKIGHGVVATSDIPIGTITYVKDAMDIILSASSPLIEDWRYQDIIKTYSYVEPSGEHVLSWDNARYMNHSCDANTLSTGYGFEIAIRDIRAGEEVTDDYGLLNVQENMTCACRTVLCRKLISSHDFEEYVMTWDNSVKRALKHINKVAQPLWPYLDADVMGKLRPSKGRGISYRSVSLLQRIAPDQEQEDVA